ncbi:MAG: nicotinate (nicotinamide) nucleotide adenylyltransferase [Bacteroidales bacterium]|nr:nicotinate (nicotinamide) nucleotide adenylyltransferase [Bacteroidales bacterium]
MRQSSSDITGLLFGSFNPVHNGHLIIANHLLQHTDIRNVWFVLSPQNPFKTGEKMLSDERRLELLKLAVSDNKNFHACDIELTMPVPSYTVHTLKKLQGLYPSQRFVLMIGSDNLAAFDRWKDYEELLSLAEIYVYPRLEANDSPFLSHPSVTLVDAPRIDISSTQIREDLRAGREPRYLLPDKVLQKIIENNYY